jgi:hypothetical protein
MPLDIQHSQKSDPKAASKAITATPGTIVQYQPTVSESSMSNVPIVAIVTAVDEELSTASLLLFDDGKDFVVSKRGVSEGDEDGQFLALGQLSLTQKATAEQKKAEAKAEVERQKAQAEQQKADEQARAAAAKKVA